MEISPSLQIRIAIKALQDVVVPAVDANNKLAQEQARLCIATLQIALSNLPLAYAYERDRLVSSLKLSRDVQAALAQAPARPAEADQLAQCAAKAAAVLDRAQCDPAELEDTNVALSAAISALASVTFESMDGHSAESVSGLILDAAGHQLLRDRSAVLGQGWEPDPKAIPPLAELLAQHPAA